MILLTTENLTAIAEGKNKIFAFVDEVWEPLQEVFGELDEFCADGGLSKQCQEKVYAVTSELAFKQGVSVIISSNNNVRLSVGFTVTLRVVQGYNPEGRVIPYAFLLRDEFLVYAPPRYDMKKPDMPRVSASHIVSLMVENKIAKKILEEA